MRVCQKLCHGGFIRNFSNKKVNNSYNRLLLGHFLKSPEKKWFFKSIAINSFKPDIIKLHTADLPRHLWRGFR